MAGMTGQLLLTPHVDLSHPQIAQALLLDILDSADIVGHDHKGRAILRFDFAVEPWLLDKLAAVGAADEDLEDDEYGTKRVMR